MTRKQTADTFLGAGFVMGLGLDGAVFSIVPPETPSLAGMWLGIAVFVVAGYAQHRRRNRVPSDSTGEADP